ncbi:MAG: putative membrane protein, partial [Saprospiraceae bacterium]
AGLISFLYLLTQDPIFLVAFVVSFSVAFSDTFSSEIGKKYGGIQ